MDLSKDEIVYPTFPYTPPTLETVRLVIRPLNIEDAEDIFAFCSNPIMTQHTLWETHQNLFDSILFVKDYARSRRFEQVPDPLGILLKAEQPAKVIGTIGCFWHSRQDGVMEIGYNIAPSYWGQGIAVEAATALMDYVFQTQSEVERIQARILEGNLSSERVAQKLGMRYEGRLRSYLCVKGTRRDVLIYSMLRKDWRL